MAMANGSTRMMKNYAFILTFAHFNIEKRIQPERSKYPAFIRKFPFFLSQFCYSFFHSIALSLSLSSSSFLRLLLQFHNDLWSSLHYRFCKCSLKFEAIKTHSSDIFLSYTIKKIMCKCSWQIWTRKKNHRQRRSQAIIFLSGGHIVVTFTK